MKKIEVIDNETGNKRLIDESVLNAYPKRFKRIDFRFEDVIIEDESPIEFVEIPVKGKKGNYNKKNRN